MKKGSQWLPVLLTWVFGCAIMFVEKIRQCMAACLVITVFSFSEIAVAPFRGETANLFYLS